MKRFWLLVALLVALVLISVAEAQVPANRVGLVVRHDDGRILTACVEFSEPTISGTEVLLRAGLDATMDVQRGGTICSIDGEGCQFPIESCFCHCETLGAACTYWAYHHLIDNQWVYSQIGASSYQVKPGTVEGWAWGQGAEGEGATPPVYTFDQLCANGAYPATVVQEAGAGAGDATPSSAAASPSALATATHQPPDPTALPTQMGGSVGPSPEPAATEPPPPTLAPTEVAVLPAPGPSPTAQSAARAPTATRSFPAGYLAFGAIVLLLLGGIAWNQQRSQR